MPTAFRAPQLTAGRRQGSGAVSFVVVRSGFMEFDSGKSQRGRRGQEDEAAGPCLPASAGGHVDAC